MSAGVMYNYLKNLTNNIDLIHTQRSISHGVEHVIEEWKKDTHEGKKTDYISKNTDLLIIVDSSSNSVEACKFLVDNYNLDIVIIDHHIMDRENPYAIIVNCQQGDYPNKHLSGSAMCYKVCQVLDEYLDLEVSKHYIDLCAIGLIGDMMSVWSMENRNLIYNGLNNIRNIGIQEVLNQSKIDYSNGIKSTDVSFKVSPIISACSRYDKIELALELVTTEDEARAKELAKEMIKLNEQRKAEQKEIVERVIDELNDSETINHNLIVFIDEEIESGFRGLVASEIVERYGKPVFIVKPFYDKNGNVVKYSGSARSISQLPLKELCEDSGLFVFATGE